MAKDERNETVTMSKADLQALIRSEVEAATKSPAKSDGLVHESDEERVRRESRVRNPMATYPVSFESPHTGCSFDAIICASTKYPEGVILKLVNYRYPDWTQDELESRRRAGLPMIPKVDATEDQGGMRPMDMPDHPDGKPNMEWKQRKWEMFLQQDLRLYPGKSARLIGADVRKLANTPV